MGGGASEGEPSSRRAGSGTQGFYGRAGIVGAEMVVEAGRRPFEAFARAAVEVASAVDLKDAPALLADATAAALGADLVLVRVVDPGGELVARAFAPEDSSLA